MVTTDLLTAQGSRSKQRLFFQCGLMRLVEWFVPGSLRMPFNWESYRMIDGIVTNTQFEADLVRSFYRTDPKRIHVIPNGVEEAFFKSTPVPRGDWLVCTATITPRKRVLELAQAAVLARTPIRFLGKAYGAADDYNIRFLKIVKDHPDLLRYEGSLSDRNELAKIYRSARGFVLLSAMETRSLSSEEAAACECPLLLSDLPWARDVFRETATYSNIAQSTQESAADLRKFYDSSSKPVPPRPLTWVDVAKAYANVYKGTLAIS